MNHLMGPEKRKILSGFWAQTIALVIPRLSNDDLVIHVQPLHGRCCIQSVKANLKPHIVRAKVSSKHFRKNTISNKHTRARESVGCCLAQPSGHCLRSLAQDILGSKARPKKMSQRFGQYRMSCWISPACPRSHSNERSYAILHIGNCARWHAHLVMARSKYFVDDPCGP